MAHGELRAAVLGCGPAGLLAAHGLARGAEWLGLKADVKVFSQKRKSPLYGCQYLHDSIPGLGLRSQQVRYTLAGPIDGYRLKVYGTAEDVSVSPGLLDADHRAWDIRQAYDRLWEQWEPAIEDYFFSQGSWRALWERLVDDERRIVISTVPAPVLCTERAGCTFRSETVWAMGDAPGLGRLATVPVELPDGTVLCSGRLEDDWYRVSRVFGHHTVEWPADAAPPRGASRVTKPLDTTCGCNPAVQRSGRYARWQKGVLAHTSFRDGLLAVKWAVAA